ncbi:MAG: cation diffusion facilitator family transporter [Candidatus Paceibacterota bacterium]|jgi:cation diffusion facilitator family transporter
MKKEGMAIKTIYLSIAGNASLAIIKWLAGILGNSHALIADAIESTTDIFSSALVLFGIKFSSKPADKNHPYGHGKAEPIATFFVVVFLVVSALIIIVNSLKSLGMPRTSPEPWTLLFLAFIIVWKEISYRLVLKKSKETGSSSLRADAWHHRSDAITSVAAFIGIGMSLVLGNGYEHADDWAALFAAGFILYNSYLIFRPALGEIMDEHSYDSLEKEIQRVADEVPEIINIRKCFIRKAGMQYHIDLHVAVDADIPVKRGHEISHELEKILKEKIENIDNVLIHIEPN